jgi:uncharacterized protein (DUF2062 family)
VLGWFNPAPAWRELREDEAARATAAAGLALGAFIANLPVYGFQTLLGLYAARRLHVHPLSVLAGSQLSTPPVGPALAAAAIAVGHLLLHGAWPGPTYFDVGARGFWPLLRDSALEWALGSVVVGLLCSGVMYALAKWALRLIARPTGVTLADSIGSDRAAEPLHAAGVVGAAA